VRMQQGVKLLTNAVAMFFEKGSEAMGVAASLVRGTKKLKVSLTLEGEEEKQHEPS